MTPANKPIKGKKSAQSAVLTRSGSNPKQRPGSSSGSKGQKNLEEIDDIDSSDELPILEGFQHRASKAQANRPPGLDPALQTPAAELANPGETHAQQTLQPTLLTGMKLVPIAPPASATPEAAAAAALPDSSLAVLHDLTQRPSTGDATSATAQALALTQTSDPGETANPFRPPGTEVDGEVPPHAPGPPSFGALLYRQPGIWHPRRTWPATASPD